MYQEKHPKAFGRTKDTVCKLYIQSVSFFSHFLNVLCILQKLCLRASSLFLFIVILVNELMAGIGMGLEPGHMHVDIHKIFVRI